MMTKKSIRRPQWLGLVALLSFAAYAAVSTGHASSPTLVDHVRNANDRFRDISVAVAEGYAAIPCAGSPGGGAMGMRYVSSGLLSAGIIDLEHPQAVMYEPMPDGKMKLIAVEYISSKGPTSLEGQPLSLNGAPDRDGLGPFYQLHVWAWKVNPRGEFADVHPNVICEHSSSALH